MERDNTGYTAEVSGNPWPTTNLFYFVEEARSIENTKVVYDLHISASIDYIRIYTKVIFDRHKIYVTLVWLNNSQQARTIIAIAAQILDT